MPSASSEQTSASSQPKIKLPIQKEVLKKPAANVVLKKPAVQVLKDILKKEREPVRGEREMLREWINKSRWF